MAGVSGPGPDGARRIDHWIGGKRVPSASGRALPVYDPATGRVQASVGLATAG